jgi:hypothetical protein
MKNVKLLPLIIPIFLSCGNPEGHQAFQEPENPIETIARGWKETTPKLHASFAPTDQKFKKQIPPNIAGSSGQKITSWKGERVNLQMLVWSSEDINKIEITPEALKGPGASTIPTENVNVHPVRYVLSDEFLTGCGHRDKDTIPAYLVADILENNLPFDLKEKTTRPVWITIDIPANATNGSYHGEIEIKSSKGNSQTLSLTLDVLDLTLPSPSDWTFHLDLWQNPFSIARLHNTELWSEEHLQVCGPYLKMLAQAGQKSITTSILHRPWGGQTYDHFESMIQWTHQGENQWSFDYEVFDKWVELAMDAGITNQINCYSMVPWGNRVRYFDTDSAGYVTKTVKPGSEEFKSLWKPFLTNFRNHLKEKGWLSITNIAMDERHVEEMKNTIDFIHEVTPEFNIALAGNYHEEIADDLKDLCVFHNPELNTQIITDRKEKGLITTFYTSCAAPEHPNNFTFSPPAEQTLIGWYAAAKGFDGFLRWAYNSWVKDPLMDSRFITWPAGDTYQIYPGPLSSIRFEKLREGIQDFEKIRIIREKLKEQNDQEGLEKLNSVLSAFTHQNITSPGAAANLVKNAKKQLNEIIVEHL